MIRILFAALFIPACSANTDKADAAAREYAKASFPNDTLGKITCEKRDSDGNGRVRCNIPHTNAAGITTVEGVECPSDHLWQWGTICVAPKG